jgi:zinc D-Ala-D-Ala carboxypeptidase
MTNTDVQLSPHFTFGELTFSELALRRGLDNTPSDVVTGNLVRVARLLLEPARQILGAALHINSGYRSSVVNTAIGGDPKSAHMEGRAVDFVPINRPILEAFHDLRIARDLPYDRIIFECAAWIHIAIAPEGQEPRLLAELASGTPGAWRYTAVA